MNYKKYIRIASLIIAFIALALSFLLKENKVYAEDPVVFQASYFNNINLSGEPVLGREENSINYDWGNSSPDPVINYDYFSAHWTSNVFLEDGVYEFTVTADDGVRLYIDNELVIDKWINQPPTTYKIQRTLSAGEHSVKMEYYENTVGATAKLSWTHTQITPTPTITERAYLAEYFNNIDLSGVPVLTREESSINYDWGHGSPDPLVNSDYFSARWITNTHFDLGRYEFTVTADDGVRLYVDNIIIIDKWMNQPSTTYTAQIDLNEGTHDIKLEYYENTVGATAKFAWKKSDVPIAPTSTPTPTPTTMLLPSDSFIAEYFNNTSLTGTPALTRNDSSINYEWGMGSPSSLINPDYFSARWTTAVAFESGSYEFTVTADDGVRLYIDNELVIDKWVDQAPTTYKIQRTLSAGEHSVKMEYYENTVGATAKLSWIKLVLQNPPQVTGGNFLAEYFNNRDLSGSPVLAREETGINYEWSSESPDPSVNNDNFSARWVAAFIFEESEYEFTVTADDGVRLYIDNELVIDKWVDQAPTTYKARRNINEGEHDIRMEYYEKSGGATAILSWNKTGYLPNPISISPGSFSFVVLPDTQKYSQGYPAIFTSQTQWITDNKDRLNIQFVLHEGDIVDDPLNSAEWLRAQSSMFILDSHLPYYLAVGNHDLPNSSGRDTSNFNSYFPYSKYSALSGFGGVFESNKMDNAYYFISAGGIDFLIISLEFGPRDAVLEWANQIVENHPDRKAIMITHDYVYDDDTLHGSNSSHVYGPDDPVYGLTDYNRGVDIWEKFTRKHNNLLFAFSGHVHQDDGAGLVIGNGDAGNRVYQMFANYQHYTNGGNGYLRFIEVNPDQKLVKVKTYSPYLNEFLTSSSQQFQFENVTELDYFAPSPVIESVEAVDKNTVKVIFTRDMDKTSSENTGNYAISPFVTINSAVLQSDTKTVILNSNDLAVGEYSLVINNVTDSAGNNILDNSSYNFTYKNTSSFSVRINSSSDDAEEFSWGETYFTSTDLEFVYDDHFVTDQVVGLRFTNLGVPQGANIVNAYIQFTVDELNTRETNINIYGESIGNSLTFSNTAYNITGRPKTVSSVSWLSVSPWQAINESGENQKTTDLSLIAQELVNLADWQSGNAMSFILQGEGRRVAYSFDGSASKAPLLYIEWEN